MPRRPPYRVSPTTAKQEIGDPGIKVLDHLQDWLCRKTYAAKNQKPPEIHFRAAPSLITRSEAELFGICFPRFAYRAYLDGDQGNFVNARRLRLLADSVAATFLRASPIYAAKELDLTPVELQPSRLRDDIVNQGRCMADSVLSMPADDRYEGFHVLQSELGTAFGEKPAVGTPFIQHIPLGGGMCGQAVCFMVQLLLEKWISRVYGIAEIAVVVEESRRTKSKPAPTTMDVNVTAFDRNGIEELFNQHLGLRAIFQTDLLVSMGPTVSGDWANTVRDTMLRAYLLSGFPIIQLVDLGKFINVIRKNKVPDDFKIADEPKRMPHAVLLVGCRADAPRDEFQFLINDPASYPFLRASSSDLSAIRRRHADNGAEINEFITVTPFEIQLPLLPGSSAFRGLFAIAEEYQISFDRHKPMPEYYRSKHRSIGEWRLVNLGESLAVALPPGLPKEIWQDGWDTLRNNVHQFPQCWHWLQFVDVGGMYGKTERAIWLWNATPAINDKHKFLSGFVSQSASSGWKAERQSGISVNLNQYAVANDPIEPSLALQPCRRLQPSLLTSFNTYGALRLPTLKLCKQLQDRHSPEGKLAVEVYCFMETDIEKLLEMDGLLGKTGRDRFCARPLPPASWRNWLRRIAAIGLALFRKAPPVAEGAFNALEFLARLRKGEIQDIAIHLADLFREYGARIVALASFIPEVSRPAGTPDGALAVAAIANLLRLADALREKGKQPTQILEIVSGSRFQGLGMGQNKDGDMYFVRMMRPDKARAQFLETLGQSLRQVPSSATKIAIELEPGPCFVLNDGAAVLDLVDRLDRPDRKGKCPRSQRVGFNLDVAHWRLAGIDPSFLTAHPRVLNRVYHSHIAGHHRAAHFGDLSLSYPPGPQDFRPWIRILDGSEPESCRFMSLELEAAREESIVADSMADLCNRVLRV